MRKQRKPKVTINCVASHYASPDERIIEYSLNGIAAYRLAKMGTYTYTAS